MGGTTSAQLYREKPGRLFSPDWSGAHGRQGGRYLPPERIHYVLPAGYVCQPSANQLLRLPHDRMPVILAPDDYPAWLGEDAVRDVAELIRSYPSEDMRCPSYKICLAQESWFLRAVPGSVDSMCTILHYLLHGVLSGFRSRANLQLEVIALRHQLAVLRRQRPGRPRLLPGDRMLWA